MVNSASAGALSIIREVTLESESAGFVMNPNTVVRANDDGFVIAGGISGTQQAWATKIDPAGQIVWQYLTNLRDKLPIGVGAEFNGAVAMPDGTTYLCGRLPRPPNVYAPALLTHIDVTGHLLSERLMVPEQSSSNGVANFLTCIRWGDDIAVIGTVHQTLRVASGSAMPIAENLYWVLAVDPEGKVKLDKLLPTTFDKIDAVGPALIGVGSNLIFSANRTLSTELFQVDMTGGVKIRERISGQLRIVLPFAEDGIIQLFGYDANGHSEILTFDDQLNQVSLTEGMQPQGFRSHLAYRMPDRSLVLFGSGTHSVGEQYTSRVIHIDSSLRSSQFLELAREPLYDTGVVRAAAPTQTEGVFAAARPLLRQTAGTDGRIGAVLDFIQTK